MRELQEMMRAALAGHATACGIEAAPVGTWGAREERTLVLGGSAGPGAVRLVHDEREAPLVPGRDDVLVSLSDEGDLAVCAWARPAVDSPLVGLGVDVASFEDFVGVRGGRFNRLLFSAHERELVAPWERQQEGLGFAYAFSAKEAAFKACAAPLRTWYERHEEPLEFEVREFELADLAHERGTLRHACAQVAMDAMGIDCIELHHAVLPGGVLTVALAFARERQEQA